MSEWNDAIEAAAVKLKEWYPDNANTNAFCAAIRSLKRPDTATLDEAAIRADEREKCAALIPTNWLHPLLSGPESVGDLPYDCEEVERLLWKLAAAIRKGDGV